LTHLIEVVLQKKFKDKKNEWKMIAKKATKWLKETKDLLAKNENFMKNSD